MEVTREYKKGLREELAEYGELTDKADMIINAMIKKGDRGCVCLGRWNGNEETLCPCKTYRSSGNCRCGLFVRK